jgi:hypothetical protein
MGRGAHRYGLLDHHDEGEASSPQVRFCRQFSPTGGLRIQVHCVSEPCHPPHSRWFGLLLIKLKLL